MAKNVRGARLSLAIIYLFFYFYPVSLAPLVYLTPWRIALCPGRPVRHRISCCRAEQGLRRHMTLGRVVLARRFVAGARSTRRYARITYARTLDERRVINRDEHASRWPNVERSEENKRNAKRADRRGRGRRNDDGTFARDSCILRRKIPVIVRMSTCTAVDVVWWVGWGGGEGARVILYSRAGHGVVFGLPTPRRRYLKCIFFRAEPRDIAGWKGEGGKQKQ